MIEFIVDVLYKGERFTVVTFNNFDSMNNYVKDFDKKIFIDECDNEKSDWSYVIYSCEEFI